MEFEDQKPWPVETRLIEQKQGRIFQAYSSIPGTQIIEYVVPNQPMAAGIVWFRRVGEAIDVLNIYVIPNLRRLGIAKELLLSLFRHKNVTKLITAAVTSDSAELVKEMGWEQVGKGWELKRPQAGITNAQTELAGVPTTPAGPVSVSERGKE